VELAAITLRHTGIGWTGIHDVLYLLPGSDMPFIACLIEDDDTPGKQTLTDDVWRSVWSGYTTRSKPLVSFLVDSVLKTQTLY